MNLRALTLSFGTLVAAGLGSCDIIANASATASLVTPVDSTCLANALTQRFGSPNERPRATKRTRAQPATLSFFYNNTSFIQTYADSGRVTLMAAQPVAFGLQAFSSSLQARQDSVSRRLGQTLLVVRDACGGRTPKGRPELTFAQ